MDEEQPREYLWRIVQRAWQRRGRTVVRWALQRGYRRTLEGWSPRSPRRRWRTLAQSLHRTRGAAEKALAAARLAEAEAAEAQGYPTRGGRCGYLLAPRTVPDTDPASARSTLTRPVQGAPQPGRGEGWGAP